LPPKPPGSSSGWQHFSCCVVAFFSCFISCFFLLLSVHCSCRSGGLAAFLGGVSWLVLSLFRPRVVRALLLVLLRLVGSGRGVLCRPVRAGRPLLLVFSFRSPLLLPPAFLPWPCAVLAGGCGCVPVCLGHLFSQLVGCPCPFGASRWRCPWVCARRPLVRGCVAPLALCPRWVRLLGRCSRGLVAFAGCLGVVWVLPVLVCPVVASCPAVSVVLCCSRLSLAGFSFVSGVVLRSPPSPCSVVAVCWLVFSVAASSVASCCFTGVCVAVVAFAGSRSLQPAFAPLVGSVVQSVVASGRSVAVGCCVGADAFALSALTALAPPLRGGSRCLCAFGAGGAGSCSLSAVSAVAAWSAAGGSVSWLAGGAASVPLSTRLSARTGAVVGSASVSAVVFFASPNSCGSFLAASLAVGRGLPVFAFACGFCPSLLPSLGAGSWVSAGGIGVWSSAFVWQSSQLFLFSLE